MPAFLIVWNDIDPAIEAEYRRWHRVEHMPERLAVPGFLLGRRYTDMGAARGRYLTRYDVASLDTFRSDVYRERIAHPTEWTQRMSAGMSNFERRVCREAAAAGTAVGGGAATIRLDVPSLPADARAMAESLVEAATSVDPVIAATVGEMDAGTTSVRKDALQSAHAAEAFNLVLMVEAESRATLAPHLSRIAAAAAEIAGGRLVAAQLHDLAFVFRPTWRGA